MIDHPDSRKPEWTPPNAGADFASRVVSGVGPSSGARAGRFRMSSVDTESLVNGILAGDSTMLSRAITIIESNSLKHFSQGQELIRQLLPSSGNSIRIGITGSPGVGKSTFIEAFGCWLISQGKKVAVLAVDPSSTLSKGSILGDKTRMEKLSVDPHSFIRPSPSGGVLGGVARKTRETIILCEAAAYDVILIETVGVGQSETTVRSMVDFFLLMQISGAGDELQGIKKGIMELADLVVVNKADGDNIQRAELTRAELKNALHYIRHATPGWTSPALTCSSQNSSGIPEIWQQILKFCDVTKASGYFAERRNLQTSQWFEALLSEALLARYYSDPSFKSELNKAREAILNGDLPVVMAVSRILDSLKTKQA